MERFDLDKALERLIAAQRGPVCPHCDHQDDASDSDGLLYSEDTTEWECGYCGDTYSINLHISYTWDTSKQDDCDD